jgi:hypothetical protein
MWQGRLSREVRKGCDAPVIVGDAVCRNALEGVGRSRKRVTIAREGRKDGRRQGGRIGGMGAGRSRGHVVPRGAA